MTDTPAFRGTPPNDKQLAKQLGPRLSLWQAVVAMVQEFEATWRWAHSEATEAWTYRAYLPGNRFFVTLSLTESGFEASFNLKAEEWDAVFIENAEEQAIVDAQRDKALATGEDPAWVHMAIASDADLKALTKLLVARGRRVQPPRKGKRRR